MIKFLKNIYSSGSWKGYPIDAPIFFLFGKNRE